MLVFEIIRRTEAHAASLTQATLAKTVKSSQVNSTQLTLVLLRLMSFLEKEQALIKSTYLFCPPIFEGHFGCTRL